MGSIISAIGVFSLILSLAFVATRFAWAMNVCDAIDMKLVFADYERYSKLCQHMDPSDPRLMRKWIYSLNKREAYSAPRSRLQKWAFVWRKALGLNADVGFTDKQRWILGIKEPYRPKSFSRVLYLRKPAKTLVDELARGYGFNLPLTTHRRSLVSQRDKLRHHRK